MHLWLGFIQHTPPFLPVKYGERHLEMAQAASPSLEKCEGVKRTTPRSRSSLACSKPQISCPCPPQPGRFGVGVKEGDVGERGREHGREVEEVGI